MGQYRREPIITDGVKLQQDTDQGVAMNADGTPCVSGVPFGVLMDEGSSGEFKAVCRLGFIPVKVGTASGSSAGSKVKPTTGGVALVTSTGADNYYAVLENDASANGALTGAWVNAVDRLTI